MKLHQKESIPQNMWVLLDWWKARFIFMLTVAHGSCTKYSGPHETLRHVHSYWGHHLGHLQGKPTRCQCRAVFSTYHCPHGVLLAKSAQRGA